MTKTKTGSFVSVKTMSAIAIMTAVSCVLGPLSIPIGPVPISLGTFVMLLCAYILGPKKGTMSCIIYILLGAVGLPVFTGYAGGFQKLTGPTGGYLVGYIFLIVISGIFIEKHELSHRDGIKTQGNVKALIIQTAGMIAGMAVCYLFGTFWFMLITGGELMYVLSICVFPFIAFDLLKILAALVLGNILRHRLKQAGLI